MDTDTAQQLRNAIRDCGLYTAAQVAAADAAFVVGGADASLADKLQAAGVLTSYQHKKARGGRATELLFGPFLVLDKIGEGGMGKVYRAANTKTQQVVALKIVRHQLMTNKTVLKRYQREARAAGALNHPNIVGLYDADEVNGRYFIAMEYVDGLDLSRMMKQFGNPPKAGLQHYQEACEYIRQAALGLQHAHDRGLVHRDIKPSNLLVYGARALPGVKEKAHVKVLDMGLVRSIMDDDASRTELTRDGTVVGTPDYMAPEQAKNSSTVDARADLYSLGCALFYLLKGHPPFPDGSPIDKLLRHQLDPPPDIRRLRPDIPAGLAAVIDKLLRKNADDRYQKAEDVALALAPYVPGGVVELAPALELEDKVARPTVEAEPFSLAAGPDAVAQGPVTAPPAAVMTPGPAPTTPPTGAGAVRVRILQPGNGKSGPTARPTARIPGATAVPRGGDHPSSGSMPGAAREAARATKPFTGEPTVPVSPPKGTPNRRRPEMVRGRKPPPRKQNKVPVWVAVAVISGVLALGVAAVIIFSKSKTPNTTPTQPTPDAGRAAGPSEPPAVAKALLPVADLLPDRTTAAVVVRPAAYWKRAAYEPTGRVTGHADGFTRRVRFDPRKFDRLTVAFVGRQSRAVALGEGAFLTPEWLAGLDQMPRLDSPAWSGQKGFEFNPFGPAPRYAVVLGGRTYAVSNDRDSLAGLAARSGKKPPSDVPKELIDALAPTDGLASFAASDAWMMPDNTSLAEHRVKSIRGRVGLQENDFTFELVLTGRDKKKLEEFLNEHIATKLPELYPAFKPLATAVVTGEPSVKRVGDDTEIRITGKLPWATLHTALEQLLPVPEKEPK